MVYKFGTSVRILIRLAAAALAIVLIGCGGRAPASGPLDLTVAHTNDTWGYLEPCG